MSSKSWGLIIWNDCNWIIVECMNVAGTSFLHDCCSSCHLNPQFVCSTFKHTCNNNKIRWIQYLFSTLLVDLISLWWYVVITKYSALDTVHTHHACVDFFCEGQNVCTGTRYNISIISFHRLLVDMLRLAWRPTGIASFSRE